MTVALRAPVDSCPCWAVHDVGLLDDCGHEGTSGLPTRVRVGLLKACRRKGTKEQNAPLISNNEWAI